MRLDKGHVRILTGSEFKLMLRSPQGILAMSFLAIYAGWVLTKLVGNAGFINSLASGTLSQEGTVVMAAVKWLANLDDDLMSRLFVEHSPFLTMLFVMVAFMMPFFTMVAALDQNASDIGSKGIRFFLPRTGRMNLVAGRFLGTSFFWAGVVVLLGVIGTLVALAVDQHHSAAIIFLDGLWFTLGLLLIALPFIAFMALCSVTTGSPLLAVTMGIGCYLGVALMGGLGGWIHEGLKVIRFVFPATLRYDLMLGSAAEAAVAAVAMLGYTAVYLFGAGWIFSKRDL
jgi:ABC-type transport system involved in multi-copper enzyme maturation permease subunit